MELQTWVPSVCRWVVLLRSHAVGLWVVLLGGHAVGLWVVLLGGHAVGLSVGGVTRESCRVSAIRPGHI